MKNYFNDFFSTILGLYRFFLKISCFLYLMIFYLSPAIGMDIGGEDEIELHQSSKKTLNIQKNDDFKNDNIIKLEIENNKISTENIPLLLVEPDLSAYEYGGNPLMPYMQNYIINDQQIEEASWARRVRLGIKAFTILYGSTGGVPYISSCCKAGQGNTFLCVAFATANVIASGGATIWAGLRIAKNLDPISNEEKEILHSTGSFGVLKHLSCNILGILTSIPGTYAVYKYNTGVLRFLVIPGFLNNYIFSTSGYYEMATPSSMVQQIFSKIKRENEAFEESNEIKEKLVNHLENHVIPSIIENIEDRNHLFENTNITNSGKDFIKKLRSLNCSSNAIERPEKWKGGYPRNITQGLSLIFPVGNAIVNYLLGYEVSNLLVDSPVVCNLFSVMVVTPNFMLDVLSSTTTASSLFDVIYNKIRKRSSANFMSSCYPKLSIALPFVSLALASLSVTGGIVVSRDAVLNSELKGLAVILPSIVFISNAISQSFQMRDLSHDAVNYFSTFREDNVGETARKLNRIEKFTSIISNCVPSIFYDFWNNLRYQSDSEDSS